MKTGFDFFITDMPKTRQADFYLGCLDGCVFIDFDKSVGNLISLCRISFDGYGCCNLNENVKPLDAEQSQLFLKEIKKNELNQEVITSLVKEIIKINKAHIWTDALEKYGLIDKG